MEEERRLCYVAMTRAKKQLYMTCNSGYSYATDSHAVPSQFYKEAKLEFPKSNLYHAYDNPYQTRKDKVTWSNSSGRRYSDVFFFGDGDAISPFEEPKKKAPKPSAGNGILDWGVGDRCLHDKFGEGTVKEIIDPRIMIVKFDSGEQKTLLNTVPMLHRINKKGGEA